MSIYSQDERNDDDSVSIPINMPHNPDNTAGESAFSFHTTLLESLETSFMGLLDYEYYIYLSMVKMILANTLLQPSHRNMRAVKLLWSN